MKKCGIYIIENTRNRKVYVGSTRNFGVRFSQHLSQLRRGIHPNPHLQNAYNIEPEAFEIKRIDVCESHELIEREKFWIGLFGREWIYNIEMDPVERGRTPGYTMAEATRAKLSNFAKRRTDHIQLMTETARLVNKGNKHRLGKKFTDEQRAAMSLARTGKKRRPVSPEARERIIAAQRARRLREEQDGSRYHHPPEWKDWLKQNWSQQFKRARVA